MPEPVATTLTGWGRTSRSRCRLLAEADPAALAALARGARPGGLLARGAGRSYGDAAVNTGGIVLAPIGFETPIREQPDGHVRLAAGLPLRRLLAELTPGRLPAALPGTAEVTVGGAVAADVHGKDHFAVGSFGAQVVELSLLDGTGACRRVSPRSDPAAFWATVGGMGLTGVILDVLLAVPAVRVGSLLTATRRVADLDAALLALATGREPYRVAWLDCLSSRLRAVLDTAAPDPQTVPARSPGWRPPAPALPFSPLHPTSVRVFNELWWAAAGRAARRGPRSSSPAGFFFPLDAIAGWNRLYGPRGFLQYQFVVPDSGAELIGTAVHRLRAAGFAPFLAVLKRMGAADPAPLSFPGPGFSLAMDLPAGRDELARLLDDLDGEVAAAGGRVYLAKDARLRPEAFAAMYPRLGEFRTVRERLDPAGRFGSDLGRRLGLC